MSMSIEEETEALKTVHSVAAAGYAVGVAWRAASDHFAGIIGFASEDYAQAERLCEAAAKDMATSIRRNWAYIREERAKHVPARGHG